MYPWETGLTFADLITRTAESMGIARYTDATDGLGNVARIPTNPHDLDLVKRMVNQGIARFLTGVRGRDDNGRARKPYTKWAFLRPESTVQMSTDGTGPTNVAGDAARYRLPWNLVSAPLTDWTISEGTTTSNASSCIFIPARDVRHSLSLSTTSGRPSVSAIAPLVQQGPPGVDDRGWEVLFFPRPDKAYTAKAIFRILPQPMVALEQRHIAGAEHDMTVLAFCIAEAKRRDASDATRGTDIELALSEADRMMEASIEHDLQYAPRTVGYLRDPSTDGGILTRANVRDIYNRGTVTP